MCDIGGWRFRAAPGLALIIALLPGLWQTPAQAEDVRYPHLERLFRPAQPPPETRARPAAPRPQAVRRRVESAERRDSAPLTPPTFFVAVIGDAMALMLADGLKEALAADRPHVGVLRKGQDSSGLVRDDFFDWRKAARELRESGERIDYVLVMLGANDRQSLRDADGSVHEPLSPRWRELYGRRVEELVAPFKAMGKPVVWVGLPVMRSERYGADIAIINEIAKAHAGKAGATFIDTWERFADEGGQFAAIGPDVVGRQSRLRTADGIHFTQVGAVKLAHFVQGDIARLAGPAPARAPAGGADEHVPLLAAPDQIAPPAAPEPGDLTTVILGATQREEALRDLSRRLPGVPFPEPPAALYFPQKPAAGPVTTLSGPALSQDGALAAAGADESAALRQRALFEGRPLDSRPGRADDFAWPKR